MIKATGRRDDNDLIVEYNSGKMEFLFNGERNYDYWRVLDYELSMCHALGGTFFPTRDDIRNVYNVLQNYFFDDEPQMETDEVIPEIPFVKGRVY